MRARDRNNAPSINSTAMIAVKLSRASFQRNGSNDAKASLEIKRETERERELDRQLSLSKGIAKESNCIKGNFYEKFYKQNIKFRARNC